MSENKKIETLAGDAMKNYRVPPRAEAKDAIRKHLVQNNLLKKSGGRNRLGLIALTLFFIGLIPSVYLLIKYNTNNSSNISTTIIPGKEKTSFPKSENKATIDKNKTAYENTVTKNNINAKEELTTDAINKNTSGSEKGIPKVEPTNNSDVSVLKMKKKTENKNKDADSLTNKTEKQKKEPVSNKTTTGQMTEEKTKNAENPVAENKSINKEANASHSVSSEDKNQTAVMPDNASAQNIRSENTTPQQNNSENTKTIAEATAQPVDEKALATSKNMNEPEPVSSTDQKQPVPTGSEHNDFALAKINPLVDTTAKVKTHTSPLLSIDIAGALQLSSLKYGSAAAVNQSYLEEAKQSETTSASFGGGLGFNIRFNRFIFQTGIGISSLKTNFTSSESKTSIDTSRSHYNYVDSIFTYTDSNGVHVDTIPTDSSWATVRDTSISKTPVHASNKVSYLEIPLLIGYQFSEGKFDFEIKAGASIALLTQVSTSIVSLSTGKIESYSSKTNSPYRSSYWNFIASANLLYNINDRFSVFLQPAMKNGLSSIFKSDYPVTKKIHSYSVGLGLRIKL